MAESCYAKTTPGTGMELMTDVLTYRRRVDRIIIGLIHGIAVY